MKLKICVNNNNIFKVNFDFFWLVFISMIVFYIRYCNGCWIWWYIGFGKCLEILFDWEDEWIDIGFFD